MASQLDIFGGETPYGPTKKLGEDPALTARLARQAANVDRITGAGAGRSRLFNDGEVGDDGKPVNPHTTDMTDFGIRDVNHPAQADSRNRVPYGPDSNGPFRKHGIDKEVPLFGPDALTTMQDKVSPDRVAELSNDPSKGDDPRFPPSYSRPLSVQMMIPPAGPNGRTDHNQRGVPTDVLFNGNHRVAAAVDRGEMFTTVRSIEQDALPDAANSHRRDERKFANVRSQKFDLAQSRMATQNAFLRKPLSGRDSPEDYI
jgi:hypothetical protein